MIPKHRINILSAAPDVWSRQNPGSFTFRVIRGWFGLRLRASHSSSGSISMLKSLWLSLDRPDPALLHTETDVRALCCSCPKPDCVRRRWATHLLALSSASRSASSAVSLLARSSARISSTSSSLHHTKTDTIMGHWGNGWNEEVKTKICLPFSEPIGFSVFSDRGVVAPLLRSSRSHFSKRRTLLCENTRL